MSGLSDNPDVMASLLRALCDPGQITDRQGDESLASWQRRAVIEHAVPYIAAAERTRLLSVPIANGPVSYTISSYTEPGHDPEDRWNRGYECAMRDVARLLGGAS